MPSLPVRSAALAAALFAAGGRAAALQPLEAFLQGAREVGPDDAEARSGREQAEAEARVALGRALPGLALHGSYTRNQYETAVEFPLPGQNPIAITITPRDAWSGSLTLTVPLVDLSSFERIAAARTSAGAARAGERATALGVEAQVAQGYYQLLADLALTDASEKALQVARVSLSVASERREAGTAALLDVDRARAEVESDVQQLAAARLAVAVAARALATLTGLWPELASPVPAEDDLRPEAPLETFEPADKDLPSVLSAEENRAAAEEQASAQRRALLPSLSASFTEQASNASGFVGHDAYWQATLALSWSADLSSLPAIRSQEAAARAARARELRATLAARAAIENAYGTVATDIERSRSARTGAQVSAEASEQALERYRAGAASQLELLQAQRDALSAEAARIEADANLKNARAQLRLAAGRSLAAP